MHATDTKRLKRLHVVGVGLPADSLLENQISESLIQDKSLAGQLKHPTTPWHLSESLTCRSEHTVGIRGV